MILHHKFAIKFYIYTVYIRCIYIIVYIYTYDSESLS